MARLLTRLQKLVLRRLTQAHPEWVRLPRGLATSAGEMAAASDPLVAAKRVHDLVLSPAFRLTDLGVQWCVEEGYWAKRSG
ncbi:MAG TPA: hypothetical protein VF765_04130 [Polyangiaceae bacterium]